MSAATVFRWQGGALDEVDPGDLTGETIVTADSFFVGDGAALALGLHRDRFLLSATRNMDNTGDPDNTGDLENIAAFWDAAIDSIPKQGEWFPRLEQLSDGQLLLHLRSAPERSTSAILATWRGDDPRTHPLVKGPDLSAMRRIRSAVEPLGATEAVILSEAGHVVEGAHSGLLWWRGAILCGPPTSAARVDSITAKSVLTLAAALGHDTHEELVTPAELQATELWVVSALHGIRIATAWVDGPDLAEKPGRLAAWRARLDSLRKAI